MEASRVGYHGLRKRAPCLACKCKGGSAMYDVGFQQVIQENLARTIDEKKMVT